MSEETKTKQYVQLTAGEIETQVRGNRCGHCGRPKKPGFAFCPTDYAALPMRYRFGLNKGLDDPFFADAYRSAMQQLVDHPHRQASLGAFGAWRHNSEDKLRAAGYVLLNHAFCSVPDPNNPGKRCAKRVVWYRTPSNARMALSFPEYEPHSTTCLDPEYFKRRREEKAAQTSAKRNRRRA